MIYWEYHAGHVQRWIVPHSQKKWVMISHEIVVAP